MNEKKDFLIYKNENNEVKVNVLLHNETIWLTQKMMAELFDCSTDNIYLHLKNIFEVKELIKEVVPEDFSVTTQHGAIEGKTQTRKVKFYNLDAIISVGYRVNSSKATSFNYKLQVTNYG